MTLDKRSPEWALGDTAQRRWADNLATRGNAVLPAYQFEECVAETKAPVMVIPSLGGARFVITPDVLSLRPGAMPVWHDVKAKSVPTWYRKLARWEHGFDFSLLEEYQEAERVSGCRAWIIVNETASPLDCCSDSPCAPSYAWLGISLCDVERLGTRRRDWPGGRDDPS